MITIHERILTTAHQTLKDVEKLRSLLGEGGLEYDEFFSILHLDDFGIESVSKSIVEHTTAIIKKRGIYIR